ncbi:MAG: hypothetical protein U0166_01130 [Acidobacteriota bacterium]
MRRLASVGLLPVLLAACASGSQRSTATLVDIKDVGELQQRFDADVDSVRLVLLLSPT